MTFCLPTEADEQVKQAMNGENRTKSEVIRVAFRLYILEGQ